MRTGGWAELWDLAVKWCLFQRKSGTSFCGIPYLAPSCRETKLKTILKESLTLSNKADKVKGNGLGKG